MQAKNHQLPESGPASNPVLYGVAHGLSEMFPPVEQSSFRDETNDQFVEAVKVADNPEEHFS